MNQRLSSFHFFQRLLLWTEKFPLFIVLSFVVIFAVAGWGLKYSRLQLDIYDVYDPGFQSSIDLTDMKSFYNDRSQMLVSFHFKTQPQSREICRLLEWSRSLTHYKEIKNVTSLWSIRAPKVQEEKVWYPKSLKDPCLQESDGSYLLDAAYSRKFFRHLISPSGTQDLVFDISFSGSDSDTSQVQYVIDATEAFLKTNLPDADADYLGMASFRYYFKKIMLQDSVYNILILIIILVFMRLLYGTWISGVYLSVTLIGANIILYGGMALAGIPIDILTNNLFLMTAVAGTADFIFVSQFQLTGTYKESLSNLITPSFFTTLTTIVGFLSLNSSDLELIQQFGNGAAIGALAEWVMLFIFLPAFLKLFRRNNLWVNPEKALKLSWLDKIQNFSLPRWAVYLCTVLMILSVPSFFFLNDQDSPVENLPSEHVLRKAYAKFQERFLWQGQVFLYFPDRPEISFQNKVVKELEQHDLVFRVENPEELALEWTNELPPLRADLIRRELSMTPLWGRYFSEVGTLRIPLYLKEQNLHSLKQIRNEVDEICKGKCRLAGQRVVYLEYGEKISTTMIESFGVSILLVVGILGFLLWIKGKFKYFLPVILSSLMGPLIILTLIALFQVPVTLITSIFLAVMVGLAGDNAIQYLLASEDKLEKGIESRSRASIVVTLVMIFGSSMFILQSLLPMKILGILFVSGFLINLMGDLWGLKGLLTKKPD